MEQPKTRVVGADQAEAVVAILHFAFAADPFMRWIMPDAASYRRNYNRMVYAMGGKAFDHGSAFVLEDYSAAALWLPPGVSPDGDLVGEVMLSLATPEQMEPLGKLGEEIDAAHPSEPHWYLNTIGVDAARQGMGRGALIIKDMLRRCDEEQLPAYLESSNEQNISFYERHGFEIITQINYGGTSALSPMIRLPR